MCLKCQLVSMHLLAFTEKVICSSFGCSNLLYSIFKSQYIEEYIEYDEGKVAIFIHK